ncbi:UDP-N-acetylmuramoylalanyl-D-glutamyl-2,6-diaminopimelate/D-alanyl-D-alanyl ligase [Desulfovibrio sp. X2]|uniref:UDP-N-acetylmuramoyl-tripeptide--D-alanyl-D- alanine ligase n=1 Tax=Desulfovibrio sp. X2 TaxID=941449 RepID=UPI000358CC08|nr:UDP-N-acetylmuramoyl-tripeptide--D-alanyl-D-alanine ligase [Desulfovibrio sp. X2]EPR44452.1 UDP-N-acetylmuramoylalanyl-D-glutamyl-2,6-diaminopimelate/D-alanyl-D-alanyl ligase [Desulfovibrio sp. X2]
MRVSLGEIAAALGVDVPREAMGLAVRRAVADSRQAGTGDLFVCLPGERADGHDFAPKAVEQGAVAVLAARPLPGLGAPVLVVPDVLRALGRLARWWRLRCKARVVAVTGSAGKTTLKEMIAQVLGARFVVAKNHKNFNNQLGLPLTILGTSGAEDHWVLELGISKPHDMEELGSVALPDIAVVHNIGPAHLEGLGDLAGVARAKASLLGFVREGGTAVVNRCYPELWEAAKAYDVKTVSLSTDPAVPADVLCRYAGAAGTGTGRFELSVRGREIACELPYPGAHFAENVGAAFAVASLCGMDLAATADALAHPVHVEGRFCCREAGCVTLIDDTYNANPLSMRSAVDCAAQMAAGQPLALVLGDMLELGGGAEEEHRALGRFIAERPVMALFWRGTMAEAVRAGLAEGGFAGAFAAAGDAEGLAAAWAEKGTDKGVILVKGSRSCRMEEFLKVLDDIFCTQGEEK